MPARVETTPPLPVMSPVAGKPLIARSDGGQLSSAGGLLAFREVEHRLGLAERSPPAPTARAPERVRHGIAAMVPRRIALDVGDTFDAVDGGQQLRLFNAHCDGYGFQPVVVSGGEGRPLAAVLRPTRRLSGAEARAFLRRLVREIRSH